MHPRVIDVGQAFLLVVDLQETYRDKLHEWSRTIGRAAVLIRAARALGLPVLCTEQYPKGLGPTAPEIRAALEDASIFEKRTFSALGAPAMPERVLSLGRRHAIVCGIETHACISQTAHDLLDWGLRVHLPEDAISARRASDHAAGYRKILDSGGIAGSVESVLLECMRTADHPVFRSVQALLK
jgi:nicotinamidase-related amidase